MKRNIIWATASYASMGEYYADNAQMTVNALRNMGTGSIQPRILKAQEEQQKRTRAHGEVQTSAWICCMMNDHLDEEWFGSKDVFGILEGQTWTPAEGLIVFPKPGRRHASWKLYVDSRRLEITCGEAPFIVSRYDAATGDPIPIERRIGLLDRKLRIVGENTDNEQDWLKWAIRAIQSVYGYEYQGDNLLIARINVLLTFVEHMERMWQRRPTEQELKTVANVIAWNFWQMDGLTGTVPKGKLQTPELEVRPITMEELGWFDGIDGGIPLKRPSIQEATPPCRVCNWRQEHTVTFVSLKYRGKDTRNMKFDFCIGNPPYQDEVADSENKTFMPPVYNLFMDAAYSIADRVELVHPARFLFNAGQTPKAWNEKMLADEHFKVLFYEEDGNKVFPSLSTPLRGGVAITYRDASENYGSIRAFTKYSELNTILHKVMGASGFIGFSSIMHNQTRFSLEALYNDYPQYKSVIGSSGKDKRFRNNIFEKIPLFSEARKSTDDIIVIGVIKNKRVQRYFPIKYVDASHESTFRWKALIGAASGGGIFGEALSAPFVSSPGEGYTQTYIGIGAFDEREAAERVCTYIKTKFLRTMLGVLKITQHNDISTWNYVPLQDFTAASDIDWTQPIPLIDQQLYRKYGLTDEEVAFIESHVKEMT